MLAKDSPSSGLIFFFLKIGGGGCGGSQTGKFMESSMKC